MPRSLRFLLALSLLAFVGACVTRGGGRGGGGGDDDDASGLDCSDADAAMQQCFQDAGLGGEFTSLYCPATNLEPGTPGYLGPDTDWACVVDSWDYDCAEEGTARGFADSADCELGVGDDDDDSVGDDDDDDDDDFPIESLPCDSSYIDLWRLDGTVAGQDLLVRVDTVSAASTFDPAAGVVDGFDPEAPPIAAGDDELDCTFPPPQYSCPEVQVETPVDPYIAVIMASEDDCAASSGEYVLRVWVDGTPSNDLILVEDDYQRTE